MSMIETTQEPRNHDAATPTLRLRAVSKSFGPVQAVRDISLDVRRHEVVGLVGENGAGKSTLLKILSGVHQPDTGTIEINGHEVTFRRPTDAVAAGVGIVHQEQSLLTNLSVAENIAMTRGSEHAGLRFGFYRWGRLNRDATEVLARIGADVDPRAVVGDLSFVDRQMVEIARALRVDSDDDENTPLVILDEPTSVLERNKTEILEREIGEVRHVGSVIFVSHRLDEVMRICDRVVVMRSGEVVADRPTQDLTEAEVYSLMLGREATAAETRDRKPVPEGTTPAIEVERLTLAGAYRDVSFTVHPGRCLAIVGTIGSGREQLCRTIFGAEPPDDGTLRVAGRAVRRWSMEKAVGHGVGYVPSERRTEGMVGGLSAADNLALAHDEGVRRGPVIRSGARHELAETWFERLDVRPHDVTLALDRFSGGNQQKVVMAKWLLGERLSVLVLDHPLRGLDPGAAETVSAQIDAARDRGAAVVLLPDTLEEALDVADEVLVMRDGEATAHYDLAVDSPSSVDLLERMV